MWNYRVASKDAGTGYIEHGIVEVYYNKEGEAESWTDFVEVNGWGSVGELKDTLKLMLEACDKPVFEHTIENSKEE